MIVRPDQYAPHVLPHDAHDELANFFNGFILPTSTAQEIGLVVATGA